MSDTLFDVVLRNTVGFFLPNSFGLPGQELEAKPTREVLVRRSRTEKKYLPADQDPQQALKKLNHKVIDQVEEEKSPDLLRQAYHYVTRPYSRIYHSLSAQQQDYLKIGALVLVALMLCPKKISSESESDDGEKVGKLSLRGGWQTLSLEGKKYQIYVSSDGSIQVNGKKWKLQDRDRERNATIEVDAADYDPETGALDFKITGRLALVLSKTERRTLNSDQVKALLEGLDEAQGTFTTPQMEAAGLELIQT